MDGMLRQVADRSTDRQVAGGRQTDGLIDKQIDSQSNRQTDRQADGRSGR